MFKKYFQESYLPGTKANPRRERAKDLITSALVPLERRKARELVQGGAPVKLHIGCGNTYLDGWVNIDLARPGRKLDLRWDLRRGLPFPTGSASAVFSEHLFEHLDLVSSFGLMRECRRALATKGVFRIGVPDLERYMHAYSGNDTIIEAVRPNRPTRAVALNEIFFFHSHRSMYDYETLEAMLNEAGFPEVHRSAYCHGSLNPSPDTESRRPETLYVEAVAG